MNVLSQLGNKIMAIKFYLLCYADEGCLYFTDDYRIEKNVKTIIQIGDDWDDYPYELNAGEPYTNEDKSNIYRLIYNKSEWLENHIIRTEENCVNDINEKMEAWLTYCSPFTDTAITLNGGDTVGEVIDKMLGVDAYVGMIR